MYFSIEVNFIGDSHSDITLCLCAPETLVSVLGLCQFVNFCRCVEQAMLSRCVKVRYCMDFLLDNLQSPVFDPPFASILFVICIK